MGISGDDGQWFKLYKKRTIFLKVNEEIVAGRFPVNKDLAVEMAALLAQVCSQL